MEARRNLESVYKRRLDEAEKKRFFTDLHLQILKQYITLSPYETKAEIPIHEYLQQLEVILSTLRSSLSKISSRADMSSLWEDSTNIAKMKLDQLVFEPISFTVEQLVQTLAQNLNLEAEKSINNTLSPATCINTDLKIMIKIVKGMQSLLAPFSSQNFSVVIKHDKSTATLQVLFEEQSGKWNNLNNQYDSATSIMDGNTVQMPIDEQIVTLYICMCLCQSMGGDLQRITTNGMITGLQIEVPCEIVDSEQCSPSRVPSPFLPIPIVEKIVPIIVSPPSPQPEPIQPPPSPIQPPPSPVTSPLPPPVMETIPLPPPVVPIEAPVATKSLSNKILNILLVEDGKILQEVFKRWWTKKGHNVFVASNGQEAIEMFKTRNFSIIFMDIEMPIKDGLATAREIRTYEFEKSRNPTPIIGVSGYATKQYREKALESGMNEFVSKGGGYQFPEIYKLVIEYCGE